MARRERDLLLAFCIFAAGKIRVCQITVARKQLGRPRQRPPRDLSCLQIRGPAHAWACQGLARAWRLPPSSNYTRSRSCQSQKVLPGTLPFHCQDAWRHEAKVAGGSPMRAACTARRAKVLSESCQLLVWDPGVKLRENQWVQLTTRQPCRISPEGSRRVGEDTVQHFPGKLLGHETKAAHLGKGTCALKLGRPDRGLMAFIGFHGDVMGGGSDRGWVQRLLNTPSASTPTQFFSRSCRGPSA